MKFILKYMTLKEVREFGKVEVCVLRWGSCEPHNLHLPYGCDTLTIEKLAEISCQKAIEKGAKVILLPSIPVGYNAEHFKFPLALNFYPTTQISILNDILFSLENHKIYKLVIMNGHGGNHINTLLQEVYGRTKVHIFLIELWRVRRDITEKLIEEKGGCHAHEEETSTMMYLYPDLVHIEWADDGKTNEPRFEEMKKRVGLYYKSMASSYERIRLWKS